MAAMLSLLDVLPRHESVDIGTGTIQVFGVSTGDIGLILDRYPNAFADMVEAAQKGFTGMDPGLTGAWFAASQRDKNGESLLGNDDVEKFARNMGAGDQMKITLAIGRVTFPDGIGPFLRGLALISSGATAVTKVVVQVASKENSTSSRQTPKPSAPPDIPTSGS